MEYKVSKILLAKIILLIGFFVSEFLLITSWNEYFGAHKSAVILLLSSLVIGAIGISFSLANTKKIKLRTIEIPFIKIGISIIIPIIGIFLIGTKLNAIFVPNPIDIYDTSKSDIIPLVGIMVERFLDGSFPYAPITEWDYSITPTYMPMQWLPFSVAKLIGVDYRWIPFSVLCIAFLMFQFRIFKRIDNLFVVIFLSILPWYMYFYIIHDEPELFAYTIESLSTAYYLILAICIMTKKPLYIGLGIALCLLSRYSFVLWLPLLGLVFLMKDYRKLLPIVLIPLIAEIVIYIIPFLSKDITSFTDSLASYTVAAVGEWQPYWQKASEKPYHLFRGIGVAGIFYDFVPGNVLERIKLLQASHLITSLLSVFLLGIFYLFKRRKINISIFLIASLKIYFVFFYYFIQVPYSYLMMVPLFTSFALIYLVVENVLERPSSESQKNLNV